MPSDKSYATEQRLNALIAPADTWHSLGSLAGFTVSVGRYRSTHDNEVEIDIEVTGSSSHANSVTFANSLPSAYRPVADRHQPLGKTGAVDATSNQWPRVFVNSSTGDVQVLSATNDTNTYGNTIRIPLD